jgi:hypothetical protein
LRRLVAIKVPHRMLVDRPEAAEAYLTETRHEAQAVSAFNPRNGRTGAALSSGFGKVSSA